MEDSDQSRKVTPVLTKRNIRSISNGNPKINPLQQKPLKGAVEYNLNDLQKNSFNEKQQELYNRKMNPELYNEK